MRRHMINFLLLQLNGESFTIRMREQERLNSLSDSELTEEYNREDK